ncbi:MAG: hypothetical protein Q4C42_04295 [Clostridia bacterium]|nr:hypothetical protein [Clostridia bacterium]
MPKNVVCKKCGKEYTIKDTILKVDENYVCPACAFNSGYNAIQEKFAKRDEKRKNKEEARNAAVEEKLRTRGMEQSYISFVLKIAIGVICALLGVILGEMRALSLPVVGLIVFFGIGLVLWGAIPYSVRKKVMEKHNKEK